MFFETGVLKVCNIHRKTPVLESLFSKVASLEAYKFIKKRLQHRCFPVNIANFLRKFYLKNTTGGCFCTWNSPGIWLYKSGNWWHIFSIKYFVSLLCISSFFLLSVLLKLLKHVKLIIFKNYNECKTKHLFLIKKKVVTRFDKKIATWRKKSIDEEKNLLLRTLKKKTISLRTQRRPYHWGP